MKAFSYRLTLEYRLIFSSRKNPMKPGHCAGNFIRIERQKTTVKDKIKKINKTLRESIVEAVKTRVYILNDFNINDPVLF